MNYVLNRIEPGEAHDPGGNAACLRPQHTKNRSAMEFCVDALAPTAWDNIAAEFDDITFDQTACFSNAFWHKNQTSNMVAALDGKPVAGARTIIMKFPGISNGLAYVRSGPFWRQRDRALNLDTYKSLMAAMIEEYCRNRGNYLSIIPRPNPDFYEIECGVLEQLGFVVTRQPSDPIRYFVKTSLPISDQLQSLDQKWRYNLRKAQKNKLDIGFFDDAEGIDHFTALHTEMVARKSFFDSDPVYLLPKLKAELPENIRPRIIIAFHNGRPVAGASIAVHGDTALYQFGASSREALSLKAGYALQWWIVEWLTSRGVHWYDLGSKAGNTGLEQFKKGFVGKQGATLTLRGEWNYWLGFQERLVASTIYTLRDIRRRIRDGWN